MTLKESTTRKYPGFSVKIGFSRRLGTLREHHFDLGSNRLWAKKRAKRLALLWQTQGDVWTEDGLKRARQIARSEPSVNRQSDE
jgi:hypothetical protein